MNPNNRITYRFDRQGKQVSKPEDKRKSLESEREQLPADNVIPLYQQSPANTIEVQPWTSTPNDEIGDLEQLIRGTNGTSRERDDGVTEAGKKEEPLFVTSDDHPFDISSEWGAAQRESSDSDLMEYELQYERPAANEDVELARSGGGDSGFPLIDESVYAKSAYRRSGKGPSWFNVFLSVAGALATGALFGYLILNLFTGDFIWPGSSGNGAGDETAGQTVSLDDIVNLPLTEATGGVEEGTNNQEGPQADNPGESVPAATVAINGEYDYTLLQYGVFSGTATRDAALQQLADKDLPRSSTESNGKYLVYAGLAASTAEASTLSSVMPDLQVYKKEVTLRPGNLAFQGDAETASNFFELTNSLVASWSTLVVTQLEQPTLSPIGQAAADAWKEKYKAWGDLAGKMEEGVTDEKGRQYLSEMKKAIDSGAEAMLAYDKATSKASLWKAQTALMDSVLAQKEWFESMSAL
ncbi:hypothetical protein [Paenibacillus soyae]|uniref:SPOR domain-containing protein n=1 Tax=Paenibacillus soyae TaxID=2969249 RepID=A0A9X2S730_9BACL|nr:hypothetical protein [Paenibacillus soyae]MCR2802625.1 hypothetical protein [Paenibacillus soyae]